MFQKTHARMSPGLAVLAAWLVCSQLAVGSLVTAQNVPPAPQSPGRDDDVLAKIQTDEVFLPVTVRNEFGTPTPGLGVRDFLVVEDGVRQEVTSVRHVPLRLVLLLDVSGSFFTAMDPVRKSVLKFVKGLSPEDSVCVMQFAGTVKVVQDWTGRPEDIEEALRLKYRPSPLNFNKTHFWDALTKAAREKLANVSGRRMILMATDAYGFGGEATPDDALDALRETNAGLYVVSNSEAVEKAPKPTPWCLCGGVGGEDILGKSQGYAVRRMRDCEERLRDISLRTGGELLRVEKPEDFDAHTRRVFESLLHQYVVSYVSSNEASRTPYRKITVLLTRPGLTASVREGYYFGAKR